MGFGKKIVDAYDEYEADETSPLIMYDSTPPAWWGHVCCCLAIVIPICCCCICLGLIIAVVVWFFSPSMPSVEYQYTTLHNFTLSPGGVNLVFTIYLVVINPNYFHLVANNVHMDVTYHETLVAKVTQPADFQVKGYSNGTISFNIEYITNSVVVAGSMMNDTLAQGHITLNYVGTLDTRILGVNTTLPFHGSYNATPTSVHYTPPPTLPLVPSPPAPSPAASPTPTPTPTPAPPPPPSTNHTLPVP